MTLPLAAFAVLGLALAAGFAWYERTHPTSRVLALVATLAALAALGRIAFAPLPNVKPTTDIVLIAGYALGGAPGFAVGAIAAFASNFFFGHGPWTPWQMVAWGIVGLGGAALARVTARHAGRLTLAAACAAAGVLYGSIMNVATWLTFTGDQNPGALGAVFATSLWFDLAHIVGNVAFCLAFGPALAMTLRRFRTRFEVEWQPVAATAVPAVLVAVLALGPAASDASAADREIRTATRYLERAQNSDGGFGAAPGARSTAAMTGWAALGLAAADRNPSDVRRGRRSVIDYLRANIRQVRDVGDVERTILVLSAAGVSPRSFGGRDLVADLLRRRRADGSFDGFVSMTSFAVLALRSTGRPPSDRVVRSASAWIARQQNGDGGFNFATRGGGSGTDDTGSAVQALVAAGRRRSTTVRRAVRFLERRQNPDGGFPLAGDGASNAQSAAWAAQALIAARVNVDRVRRGGSRTPLGYLRSLTGETGEVRYSRTSRQTPVWVTAQALAALARKPFPLRRVARERARSAGAAAPPPATEPPATEPPATPPARPRPALIAFALALVAVVARAAPAPANLLVAVALAGRAPAKPVH